MANPNPKPHHKGRPKGSHEISPQIRGAIKRALLILEERKKPLSLLIADEFERNPVGMLGAAAKFETTSITSGSGDGKITVIFGSD